MATRRVTRQETLKRSIATDSISSSIAGSAVGSPAMTPLKSSPSSTSMSSLDSDAVHEAVVAQKKAAANRMLDTWGNTFEMPDFTIKQIRDAIPNHCYQRSAARGLAYVARDIFYLAVVFTLYYRFVTPDYIPSAIVRAGLWAIYTVVQGMIATGLWVLAHECGHQSFSPSKVLNDTVGFVLHSALLVPYFSWKFSHGKHHKATGHMERDMTWTPRTRDEYATSFRSFVYELHELTEETPIATVLHLIGQQLLGWPLYLITNVTGHNNHDRQPEGRGQGKRNGWFSGVSHFDPASPLYEAKDAKLIFASDLGLLSVAAVLYSLVQQFGFTNMLVWYFLPYLWVNHWLGNAPAPSSHMNTTDLFHAVAITFLQHTDPSLPHYRPETWTFPRGAAATIDREFGFIGRHLFHGIIETHVLHHFVSTIPFYHADEATEAIKPIMGAHYRSDTKDGPIGFLRSLWRSARMCQWVESTEGTEGEAAHVLFYRNRNGLGVRPTVISAN